MNLFQDSPGMHHDFTHQLTRKDPDKKSNVQTPTATKTALEDKNDKTPPPSSTVPPAPTKRKYRIFCRFQFGDNCYRRDMYGNLQKLGYGRRIRITRLYK